MNLRYLLGPENATVPAIAVVGTVTIVLFVLILAVARRRRSYASVSLSLLAVAYAGVALASCFALWSIRSTFEELAKEGGGIGTISFGFWQAARLPLAAAWIAGAATLLALIIALRADAPSTNAKSAWWTGGVAIAAGVAAVLAFRGVVEFSLDAMLPGRQPWWLTGGSAGYAIHSRLVGAVAVSALCFLGALALAVMTLRRGETPQRGVVAVLVASVVVTSALVAGLQSYSSRFRATYRDGQPIVSRISSMVKRRQVYIGVSRTVYFDDSVSRSSCTRSRNSSA